MSELFLSVGYAATSATLAVANKWALVKFPYSGTLTVLQFGFSAVSVRALRWLRVVEADALSFKKVRSFAPAVVMFYVSIAANLRLLSSATVDTFIVARSVTPIITQLGETVLFNSKPNHKAMASLLVIAIGASGYARHNPFGGEVLFWASVYVLCVSLDMLVVKKIVTDVQLTRWGYVYYNNTIALVLYPGWALMTGEAARLLEEAPVDRLRESSAVLAVFVSCAVGLGISFFGLNTRRALSATAFTVLGASCKFLSILINTLCWSHHAPLSAIPWLCLSLLGSIAYQQSSTPKASPPPTRTSHQRLKKFIRPSSSSSSSLTRAAAVVVPSPAKKKASTSSNHRLPPIADLNAPLLPPAAPS